MSFRAACSLPCRTRMYNLCVPRLFVSILSGHRGRPRPSRVNKINKCNEGNETMDWGIYLFIRENLKDVRTAFDVTALVQPETGITTFLHRRRNFPIQETLLQNPRSSSFNPLHSE